MNRDLPMMNVPTYGQAETLKAIFYLPADWTVTALSEACGVTRQAAQQRLEVLERHGWVRERRVTVEGRKWIRRLAR